MRTVLIGVAAAALAATMVALPAVAGAGGNSSDPQLGVDDELDNPAVHPDDAQILDDRLQRPTPMFTQQGSGDGSVKVELLFDVADSQAVMDAVTDVGGQVVGSAPGVLLVAIFESDLTNLIGGSSVEITVREPIAVNLEPEPPAIQVGPAALTDIAALTNAASWHAAGERGGGVKVGIIDFFDGTIWNAAQASGAVRAPAATFCLAGAVACDIWTVGSAHGVAVAEAVYTMAPDASIYLATVGTTTDLAAAIRWFDSQGVQVISRSLGSPLDSAGDGTGALNAIVDDAVSRGMAWFNSAGNHASAAGTDRGAYWRGPWVDADADGWLEFAPGDEVIGMYCSTVQGFRWSDWAGNATDYDVIIFSSTGTTLAISTNDQTSGAPPLEMVGESGINCAAYPVVYLSVKLFAVGNGTSGDVLELMVHSTEMEYSQNPYSATAPISDSSNPGLMTIGAIDPAPGASIAPYSSQGPTNDGRTKPDVTAPSCFASFSYAPECFNGTSAAAPVAAGAAALLIGAEVAATPEEVANYLRTNAIDPGAGGSDNVFGSGKLWLGSPPASVPIGGHSVALVDPTQGQWHLYSLDGKNTGAFYFGNPGDYPFMGDWNGDGIETPGMYRQSDGYVYLRNSNTQGIADTRFFFGDPGDVPIAGDFNGDGFDTVSIYRPSNQTFYIINKLGANDGGLGPADFSYIFGNPGDKPFVGDFDGDDVETVGLHRESTGLVYFRNSHTEGNADYQFIFGDPDDRLVAGDWNDDGGFSPAVFRPSRTTMFFRYTNTAGNADHQFEAGQEDWIPVSGYVGDLLGLQVVGVPGTGR